MPDRTETSIRERLHAAAPEGGAPRGRRRRWLERSLVGAAMAVVIWFLHWTVAANNGFEDWGDLDYFKLLVRGWKKGELSLDKAPAPELLALQDPYDPNQNGPYKLGDASLYKGKYYIYFGAAPALTLMLPYGLITGREMTMGYAAYVFICTAFLVASGLWLAIRRRYFPGSGLWIAPLGVLALGFGTHLLALAQRPMIWELPISAGIAFTLLGVTATYWAIHGRRPLLAMALAGLAIGLAVGSRPTCLLASAALAVPVLAAWLGRDPARVWWRMGLAAAIPLGLCGLALMWHNYARFENPLEWGQNYQLSGAYEGKLTHFSIRFLLHNLSVYLFQLLRWSAEFPFALAVGIEIDHIPGYFGTEEVAGLMVTFPFFWFLLALPLVWWRRGAAERTGLTLALACLAGYIVPVGGLVMCYFSTTTRYQADFALGLAVFALVGLLAIERWAQERRKAALGGALPILTGGMVAVTMAIGVMMSFDYHGRSLRITSPKVWSDLASRSYAAVGSIGLWLERVEGPKELKVRFTARPTGTVETFWNSADRKTGERIVVQHIGERLIRFGYARGDGEIAWGRDLKWDHNHTHTVSVQLPSLYADRAEGVWETLQAPRAFRMRTCVAVWFSGGRALGLVVPRLPAGTVAGGAVGKDFTGEVRKMRTRIFRPDEIDAGLADYWAKRGGVLRMRILFPEKLQESGEPIFATGAHYRSSIVFVEESGDGGMKFTFENYTFPRVHSPSFRPNPAGHVLELEMASFNPEAFGEEATGDVVIRLDGREMMRTRQVAYPSPWGNEAIGANPFGTTCALEFRGWIHGAVWLNAGTPPALR